MIVGGNKEDVPGATHLIGNVEKVQINDIEVTAHHTPCYTVGHMMYELRSEKEGKEKYKKEMFNGYEVIRNLDKALFSGDTLFVGGCGMFYEGYASQMVKNMRLCRSFDPKMPIFPGHDVAIDYLRYAVKIDK
jgi:hydroxyacylglutathione hydrolase